MEGEAQVISAKSAKAIASAARMHQEREVEYEKFVSAKKEEIRDQLRDLILCAAQNGDDKIVYEVPRYLNTGGRTTNDIVEELETWLIKYMESMGYTIERDEVVEERIEIAWAGEQNGP